MAQTQPLALPPPTPEAIKGARRAAGHTQAQAAACVHRASFRAWQRWEAGDCPMDLDAWELYLLKTGQHPHLSCSTAHA